MAQEELWLKVTTVTMEKPPFLAFSHTAKTMGEEKAEKEKQKTKSRSLAWLWDDAKSGDDVRCRRFFLAQRRRRVNTVARGGSVPSANTRSDAGTVGRHERRSRAPEGAARFDFLRNCSGLSLFPGIAGDSTHNRGTTCPSLNVVHVHDSCGKRMRQEQP